MAQQRLCWAGPRACLLLLSTLGGCLTVGADAVLNYAHADPPLDGTWWLVSSGSGASGQLPANEAPFFTVTDMTVQGFDGCNHFSGRLDQPGEINSTRAGCSDSVVRLPLDLNDLLTHLKTGRFENGVLIVPARGRFPEATFIRHGGAPKSAVPHIEEDRVLPAR